jgi:hypothetical protein
VWQDNAKEKKMTDTYGHTLPQLLARFDQDTQSWKMLQDTLLLDWSKSLESCPKWGMTRHGELFALVMPVLPTSVNAFSSLPTPSANDTTGAESQNQRKGRKAGGPMLRDLPTMLPTPTTQDGENNAGPSQHNRNSPPLNTVVMMLPTPAVNDMGDNKTLEWWDEWAPRQQSSTGRKAPHGKSLAIEAMRLFQ